MRDVRNDRHGSLQDLSTAESLDQSNTCSMGWKTLLVAIADGLLYSLVFVDPSARLRPNTLNANDNGSLQEQHVSPDCAWGNTEAGVCYG